MLAIKGLAKTYAGRIQALKGVDLTVPPGMFGLLGPNGSGKTTLMKIVATLLEPDAGSIEMNGTDVLVYQDKARRMLGYLPQEFGLYPLSLQSRRLITWRSSRACGRSRSDAP